MSSRLFARRAAWFFAVALLLAGAAGATYLMGGSGSPAVNFFYIPIIVAAFVFGDLGGLFCASVAAYIAGPLMPHERGPTLIPQDISELLIRYAVFLTVALVTSRLCAVIRAHAEQFANLFQTTRAVNSTLERDQVLDLITENVKRLVDAKGVLIRLLNQQTGELVHMRSVGLSDRYIAKGPVIVDKSELDQRVLAGETVHIEDVSQTDLLQYPKEVWEEGLRSAVCVPLVAEGKTIGVFRVYSDRIRRYSADQISLIQTFANVAAVAIWRAGLYENLRSGYVETVSALMRALEAKDPVSRGHSERVTELVVEAAREMGFDEEKIEALRFGALLHDIGYIGTPDVGLEQNRLAEDVIRMNHPLIGRSILEPVAFLRPVLRMVECHHEYYDGTGFPQGLKGDEIPIEGLLLAAANEYDIMTSGIGVEAVSPEEAEEHLRKHSGTRFHPRVVEALLTVLARRRRPGRIAVN